MNRVDEERLVGGVNVAGILRKMVEMKRLFDIRGLVDIRRLVDIQRIVGISNHLGSQVESEF